MARKPETRLQTRIRKSLTREVGGVWVKLHVSDFMGAGLPDLLGVVEGMAFLLEVKPPGEEPSRIQVLTMKKYRRIGKACSRVVESPDEAVATVRAWLNRNARG